MNEKRHIFSFFLNEAQCKQAIINYITDPENEFMSGGVPRQISTKMVEFEFDTRYLCEKCQGEAKYQRISGSMVDWSNKRHIALVEAGVDPLHQTDHCDWCGKKGRVEGEGDEELIQTCTHFKHVTICRECRDKAGTSVR